MRLIMLSSAAATLVASTLASSALACGPYAPLPAPLHGVTEAPPVETPVEVLVDYRAVERQIVAYVNQVRAWYGLPALVPATRLTYSARAHSQEMYELDYFSHTSPTASNRDLGDRMRNVGLVRYRSVAENIAMRTWSAGKPAGEDLAATLVQMWLDSPSHREAMLNPSFTVAGVGVWGDRHAVYATHHFANVRDQRVRQGRQRLAWAGLR